MVNRTRGGIVTARLHAVIAAITLGAVLGFARPAAAADPPPLLTFPSGANATLVLTNNPVAPDAGGSAFSARLPVAVAPSKNIDVKLIDAVYKDMRSAEVFRSFKVDLDRTAAPASTALLVTYSDARLWPGTYTLTLRVSDNTQDAKGKLPAPVDVLLNVQVPAPQLSGSTKLSLSFAIDALWSDSGAASTDTSVLGSVQLAERGGKAGAYDLTAIEFHDTPADAATGTGTLVFDPPRVSVPANSSATVAVSASGVFPLGVTKGKIEWISASLAAPQAVPFEVKVTRARYWIAVIAIAGVLSGFVLRKLLTDFQGKLAAREAVTLSLLQASRALDGRADSDYREQIGLVVRNLEDALVGDDAKTMTEAANTAASAIKALSDALEARFPPVRDKLSSIHALVDQWLHLPEPVAALAEGLRLQVARSNELVQQRDMTSAEAALKRLAEQDVPDMIRATAGLFDKLERFLRQSSKAPFPMGVAATQLLRDLATEATAARTALAAASAPNMTEARSLLLRADDLWSRCQKLAHDAESLSRELCTNAAAKLQPFGPAADQAFEPVANASIAAARRFAADMQAVGSGPVFGGHPPLVGLWLACLKDIAKAALPATAQPLLEKAEWLDALQAAIDARIEADRQAGLPVPLALNMAVQEDAATVAALALPPPTVLAVGGRINSAQPILRPDDLARQRQVLVRRTWQAEALRSIGLGAVFVLVSYLFYGDAWIGTYKEMATLFVLAFGLDLTGDGVVAAFKKT